MDSLINKHKTVNTHGIMVSRYWTFCTCVIHVHGSYEYKGMHISVYLCVCVHMKPRIACQVSSSIPFHIMAVTHSLLVNWKLAASAKLAGQQTQEIDLSLPLNAGVSGT